MGEPLQETSARPVLAPAAAARVVEELLSLLGVRPSSAPEIARRRLRVALTLLAPGEVPGAAWPLLEALWATEARGRAVTVAASLPRTAEEGWGARLSLWRGDLTVLAVDAIVNAANPGLTGCSRARTASS